MTVEWYEWEGVEAGSRAEPGAHIVPGGGAPLAAGREAIRRAAELLDEGGIIVHPTSTVYGVGGRPQPEIDEAICAVKGRPRTPLIRLAATPASLAEAVPGIRWTGAGRRLAEAFWPGPLTLVVDDGSGAGVAVRIDAHPVVQSLLELAGGAMTSTSLNLSGQPPARTGRDAGTALARLTFGCRAGWLHAGDLPDSPPSTVVRPSRDGVELIREGAISSDEVESVAGPLRRT